MVARRVMARAPASTLSVPVTTKAMSAGELVKQHKAKLARRSAASAKVATGGGD